MYGTLLATVYYFVRYQIGREAAIMCFSFARIMSAGKTWTGLNRCLLSVQKLNSKGFKSINVIVGAMLFCHTEPMP